MQVSDISIDMPMFAGCKHTVQEISATMPERSRSTPITNAFRKESTMMHGMTCQVHITLYTYEAKRGCAKEVENGLLASR